MEPQKELLSEGMVKELFDSLKIDPEKNYYYSIAHIYKSIENIKGQINNPEWSDLKSKTIVTLSLSILKTCVGEISHEYVKDEILKSEEFVQKLTVAFLEDIKSIEEGRCSDDFIYFVLTTLNKYTDGGKNLLLNKFEKEDRIRIMRIIDKN